MLDFRINTFLTVCQTMNFTKAANELHITQPAVSQHIRFLEKEYNTTLFQYQNKKLQLTAAGEILKKRLLTMQNDEKALVAELQSTSAGIDSLSLGVTMTIGEYAIINPLAEYLKNHPETNMHLHYGNTEQLLDLLSRGEINVALVAGNYSKEKYEHKKYSTENYIAVCAASHKFQGKWTKNISDLTNERLLIREEGSGTRNILAESLHIRGIEISDFKHYIEVENMHTIIGLLKKDCGISFVYKIAVEEELNQGILKEICLDDFKMKHDFDFIWEKGSIYSEKYTDLCEELIVVQEN